MSIKVRVLFFGMAHDLAGLEQEEVEVSAGESLEGLWRRYETRFPRLRELADSLLVAVNLETVQKSRLLRDGDEVAFMPPVSGGCSDDFYLITRDPISTHELARGLKSPRDGAVVVFEGIVRDHSAGRRTLYLEYEAYEPMAIRKMQEIGRELREKFGADPTERIGRVGIIHRMGRLEIGETSVAIVVTAAHRRAAFEACHYAIDRLKQIVPIWKKEYFEGGAVWVEGAAQPQASTELREALRSEQR